MRVNNKYNVLYVKGITPGGNHSYARIMDTRLPNHKRVMEPPSMPTFYPEDSQDPIKEEYFSEDVFEFTEPSIQYVEEKGK